MKKKAVLLLSFALLLFVGCSSSSDSTSGQKSEPAKTEKSITESAKDYLMNPIRQKRKAIKELDKALAKRDSEIARQLDEVSRR